MHYTAGAIFGVCENSAYLHNLDGLKTNISNIIANILYLTNVIHHAQLCVHHAGVYSQISYNKICCRCLTLNKVCV
jgi:hypothetical protein